MEEERKYKHSCRYCKKKFVCGRALGGHMRSHMTIPWNEIDESHQKMNGTYDGSDEMCGVEGHHEGGYGLRENPKKSLRFSDSVTLSGKDAMVCKECGKGFPSSKSLFGHMKCHSERSSLDEGSCIEVQIAFDGHSDSETGPKRRPKRRAQHTALLSVATFRSTSASYVCDIDREQEDVAITLMMLSRGTCFPGFRRGCASQENFQDSPDKSFVSKFRSSFRKEVNIQNKKAVDLDDDGRIRKPFKHRSGFIRTELDASADNGRSGIASDESKKAQFGTQGRRKIAVSAIESNRESDYESEGDYEVLDSELEMNSSKLAELDVRVPEFGKNAYKRARIESSGCRKQTFNGAGYECTGCKKLFHTYQALGGHRASHKRVKGCYARVDESQSNSTDTNISPDRDNATIAEDEPICSNIENVVESGNAADEANVEVKKGKVYECPVCFKVFNSGQALGGHKRSHMLPNGNLAIGGDETSTVMSQQQMRVIGDFLDLNLPAPDEHDSNDDQSRSSSSLTSSDLKQSAFGKERKAQLISENFIGSSNQSEFHVGPQPLPPPCLQV